MSSIKVNNKIQGLVVTNTIGIYSHVDRTFLYFRMVRFVFIVCRMSVRIKLAFKMSYFEQETLNNSITDTLGDEQGHAMLMNLM